VSALLAACVADPSVGTIDRRKAGDSATAGEPGGSGTAQETGDTGTGAPGVLALHLFDVGQGDAVLLEDPAGRTMMIDSGDTEHYPQLTGQLAALGITTIDTLVVSHLHADHMGSAGMLLNDHPEVASVLDNGGDYWTTSYDAYVDFAGERRATVATGDTFAFGDATVDVLHASENDRENENNNSIVLRVTWGGVRFLLGGDCEADVCEAAVLPGPIDVYKVHHHGASDSTSAALVREMSPSIALISCGLDNDYGHPHQATLDLLASAGAEVWRTDTEGAAVVRTDGTTWTLEAE
jgi:beta-lactamase superfamily II metal-dependent hydrolase